MVHARAETWSLSPDRGLRGRRAATKNAVEGRRFEAVEIAAGLGDRL
ncbi:MAG TPA: hypothetical protein V6D02_16110 [Candidatus Obscuribacterales bacterium]